MLPLLQETIFHSQESVSYSKLSYELNFVVRLPIVSLLAYKFIQDLRSSLPTSCAPAGLCVDFLFLRFVFSAYKTVSGVNGPLVILDDVKV